MAKADWKVGQEVCVVLNWRKTTDVTKGVIAKIGRKWATLKGYNPHRFDVETGALDGKGFSPPGYVHADEDAYRREQQRQQEWKTLHRRIYHMYDAPPGVTTESIAAFMAQIEGKD